MQDVGFQKIKSTWKTSPSAKQTDFNPSTRKKIRLKRITKKMISFVD